MFEKFTKTVIDTRQTYIKINNSTYISFITNLTSFLKELGMRLNCLDESAVYN